MPQDVAPPVWFRLLLIVMSVGGGFTGACVILQAMMAGRNPPLNLALYAVFLLIHAFVVAAGLVYVQSSRRLLLLAVALLIQTPAVSSPFIEFRLGIGLIGFVGLTQNGTWLRFFAGSDWHFTVFQPMPWGIGINLASFFVFCGVLYYLVRHRAAAPADEQPKFVLPGRKLNLNDI